MRRGGNLAFAGARRLRPGPLAAGIALSLLAATAAACAGARSQPAASARKRPPSAASLLAAPSRLADRQVSSTGCGRAPGVRAGHTVRLTVAVPAASAAGSRSRTYWLHVPVRYDPHRLTALVLAFHGGGSTGSQMERVTGLSALADREGFLVAYPNALRQGRGRYPPGWDSSGPADPYAGGIDDGLFVSDALTAIQAAYCVDPARIWATGFSNGASMVGYLACVLAARIAAFAPVEAVFFQIPGGCHPAHPAAILDVHVRTDPVAPYAGAPARGSPDYYALSIPMWLRGWASRDGCNSASEQVARHDGMTQEAWTRCPGHDAVVGEVLPAGGHAWFSSMGATAGDNLVLKFFAGHVLRPVHASWVAQQAESGPVPRNRRIGVSSMHVFQLPTAHAEPFDVATGSDGSVWFTEFAADKIGRITPAGKLTEFRVPSPGAEPYQITAGAHGTMWFSEYNTTKIGRASPSGQISEFQIPRPSYGGTAMTGSAGGQVLAADPAGFVDVVSATGVMTRIKVPSVLGLPFAIARLGNGDVWLSELTGFYEFSRHLLRFPAGSGRPTLTVTLPSPLSDVVALAAGTGGSAWFADFGNGDIGEVHPDGRLSVFGIGDPFGGLSDIARGPDGAMWFSEQNGVIGRVADNGQVTELALPLPGSNPDGIAAGRARTVWVAATGIDAVIEITLR
ncbi:MAG TPA: PHB depolymerase family esterase [Streptosporangiaceae bacterium]|nr:PHB depolymerase family esterase [Streptosporangiaceae bacterium]